MDTTVVGIGNQDKVHYGIPVRVMVKDATGYGKQLRQIKRFHRRKRDLRGGRFLGGFTREDEVHPILTICVCYSSKPYDRTKELYEMMECQNFPESLRYMLNNYEIWVLEIRSLEDIDRFKTDLREVFGFIQRAGDKETERAFALKNEKKFKLMDEDAFDVITALTGSAELESMKDAHCEEEEKVNMCEAIKGMIEDRKEKGKREEAYRTANNMYIRGFSAPETTSLLEENLEAVTTRYEEWARK